MAERGFLAPVFDAQRIFRTLLTALSEPGRVLPLAPACLPTAPLDPAAAAIVLALCDADTPLWLSSDLAPAAAFIRFHTGAPIARSPQEAQFVLAAPKERPPLSQLNCGTPDYPDRAATLLLAVQELDEGAGWSLSGPGIPGRRQLLVHGIDSAFAAERRAMKDHFPLGVDIVFVARDRIAALPRSTRVEA